jgi:hypothetical protein
MVSTSCVRPVLDKEQIQPANKGSGDNGFVFGLQPKIAVALFEWIISRNAFVSHAQRHSRVG